MTTIFDFTSYKHYLEHVIKQNGRGAVAKMAAAAECNRTYLSQCLSSKVQLTPDHILGISDYLGLKDDEQEYLLMMLLHDRSASKSVQNKIKRKMSKLVQANLILSKKISKRRDSSELTEEQKATYYSSWKMAAVHTLTSIPEFQMPSAIAAKLRIGENEIFKILTDLQSLGLLSLINGRWQHTSNNIHVPVGSSHTIRNHVNWRIRSIDDMSSENSVHYTTVFSLTRADWEKLRANLIEFIAHQRDFIHQSGTEEMFCFCCDLFQPFE